MANAIVPFSDPANHVTYTATADITAGQLVELTGNLTVGPAAADSVKCVGWAPADIKSGAAGTVISVGIVTVTSTGADITAGAAVICATAGAVKAAPTGAGSYTQAETTFYQRLVGRAVEAITNGSTGRIKLTAL